MTFLTYVVIACIVATVSLTAVYTFIRGDSLKTVDDKEEHYFWGTVITVMSSALWPITAPVALVIAVAYFLSNRLVRKGAK